jgi:hypothetical protein
VRKDAYRCAAEAAQRLREGKLDVSSALIGRAATRDMVDEYDLVLTSLLLDVCLIFVTWVGTRRSRISRKVGLVPIWLA